MITQWYEPEPAAAAHPTAVARAIQGLGNDLRVVTGFPSYPRGELYPGYKFSFNHIEDRNGISVRRVPAYLSHDNSAPRRLLSLGSFAASATMHMRWLAQADVCLVYLTPATVGIPAAALRLLSDVPFVLYVQDLWPDSVTASGLVNSGSPSTVLMEKAIHKMCGYLYGQAHSVAAIAPGMRDILLQRGVPADKLHVIYNWVDEEVFRPAVPDPELKSFLGNDVFSLMYAGGIGDLQGLDTAVEAVRLLRDRVDIRLAFVGDGVARAKLERLVARDNLADRIRFFGGRGIEEMPGILASASAQLVSLKDVPLFWATVPSKTQAVLASGLPVIVSAPGDSAGLVAEAGAGFTAEPEDPISLADAIFRMTQMDDDARAQLGRNGREFYIKHSSQKVGAVALNNLLETARLEGRRSRGRGVRS